MQSLRVTQLDIFIILISYYAHMTLDSDADMNWFLFRPYANDSLPTLEVVLSEFPFFKLLESQWALEERCASSLVWGYSNYSSEQWGYPIRERTNVSQLETIQQPTQEHK